MASSGVKFDLFELERFDGCFAFLRALKYLLLRQLPRKSGRRRNLHLGDGLSKIARYSMMMMIASPRLRQLVWTELSSPAETNPVA